MGVTQLKKSPPRKRELNPASSALEGSGRGGGGNAFTTRRCHQFESRATLCQVYTGFGKLENFFF